MSKHKILVRLTHDPTGLTPKGVKELEPLIRDTAIRLYSARYGALPVRVEKSNDWIARADLYSDEDTLVETNRLDYWGLLAQIAQDRYYHYLAEQEYEEGLQLLEELSRRLGPRPSGRARRAMKKAEETLWGHEDDLRYRCDDEYEERDYLEVKAAVNEIRKLLRQAQQLTEGQERS